MAGPRSDWTTPWLANRSATPMESGRRTRVVVRTRSTQKFPIVSLRRRASPRIKRDRDRDPDGCRHEVLHRQPRHLGQMAHRRLAAVVLPVRVRDETDGGIEGQRRRHRADVGRIQRQLALQALEEEEADDGDGAEGQQRERVHRPRLLPPWIDPAQAVEQPLDRCEDPVTGSGTVTVDTREVRTEQPRSREQETDEDADLEPRGSAHPRRSGTSSAQSRYASSATTSRIRRQSPTVIARPPECATIRAHPRT